MRGQPPQAPRPKRRRLIVLACCAGAALAVWGALTVAGTVVVDDPANEVAEASVMTGNGRSQKLHRLPGGTLAALARREGEVRIVCRNGNLLRAGYAAPHIHERLRIRPASDCGFVDFAR